MARKVFPSSPNLNDIFTSTKGKKFQWNGKVWKRTADTNVESMTLDNSVDEKLVLRGSDNPLMRFVEGSTNKGNLHWNASAGQMRLVNQESSQELRVGSSGVEVTGNLDVTGNLEVTGTTTFNGGTLTLGDADSDNVVFGADVNSSIIPNTDDTYDLGSSSQQWRNLHIDGTANIDSLVADTADINGGTVDGAAIGGNSPSSGAFTSLSASGNVDLGNATSDTITATGRFDSDLVPSTDSARALGTTALRWSNLFIDAATVTDDVSIGGNLEVIGNANITGTLTYEDVTNIDSVGVVTARSGLVVSSGGANITGGITGDLTGDVTGNADTATTLATSRTLSISGAGSGSASFNGGANATISLTLADSGASAGTYGSATAIPEITVDAKGLITSISTNSVNTTTNLSVTTTTTSNTIASSSGTNATINEATGSAAGLMSTAHHNKLDGIASGATNVSNNNQLTNGAGYITSSGTAALAEGLTGTPNITVGTISCGNITSSGTVTANSDAKLKKNVATVSNALDKVNLLRGVEFDYIADDKHSIGVIAQEVEAVLPDLVEGDETKSVAYGNLTAVLIEAVKELTSQVNTLKAELNTLKGE